MNWFGYFQIVYNLGVIVIPKKQTVKLKISASVLNVVKKFSDKNRTVDSS